MVSWGCFVASLLAKTSLLCYEGDCFSTSCLAMANSKIVNPSILHSCILNSEFCILTSLKSQFLPDILRDGIFMHHDIHGFQLDIGFGSIEISFVRTSVGAP